MTKIKIIFLGGVMLEVTDYDDIKTIKEAIIRKDKWVEIDEQIINLDNVAYVEMQEVQNETN